MKIKRVFILALTLIILFGCNKNKINDLEKKATNIKASYPNDKDSILKALNLLNQAYMLDSTRLGTNIHLAMLYSSLKNYNKVVYHSRKVLQNDKYNAEAMVEIGITYERESATDSATIYYKSAYKTFIIRPQKKELKKVIDLCDAAYMLVLISNDTTKAINFVKEHLKNTNKSEARWLYEKSIKMIETVDRKTYVDNFE